jgi:D-sedoheptulose 7-phosphate isomerase
MLETRIAVELETAIQRRIEERIVVTQSLLSQVPVYTQVANMLIEAYRAGKKALFFGNGGSAADAQHIAAEFMGKFYLDRRPLPALALTVNTSVLTAIGNDYGFEQVFARQIKALGNPGDIAIGISTSGNSANVIEGLCAAKSANMITIGMTGLDGGLLKDRADYCICIPSKDTPRIQEAHILIGHIWSELVEQALFGGEGD